MKNVKKGLILLLCMNLFAIFDCKSAAPSDKHAQDTIHVPKEREKKVKIAAVKMPVALELAIKAGDVKTVGQILDQNPEYIESVDRDGLTPLLYAFAEHYNNPIITDELLLLLIQKARNVDAVGEYGITSLMYAVQDASIPIIRALIGRKADVNREDHDENSVLMHAVRERHVKNMQLYREQLPLIQFLVASGAQFDLETINKLLKFSFESANPDLVRFLVQQKGANVNSLDEDGWPIFWNVFNQFDDIEHICASPQCAMPSLSSKEQKEFKARIIAVLEILLKAGVNIELTDDQNKNTALLRQAWRCNFPAVTFLVEHGANKDARDAANLTPLEAAEYNAKYSIDKKGINDCDQTIAYLRKLEPSYKLREKKAEKGKEAVSVLGMEKQETGALITEFLAGSFAPSKEAFNALKKALATNNMAQFRKILMDNPPLLLLEQDEAGDNLLMIAVKNNNLLAVRFVLLAAAALDKQQGMKLKKEEKELTAAKQDKKEDIEELESRQESLQYRQKNMTSYLTTLMHARNVQGMNAQELARHLGNKDIVTFLDRFYKTLEKFE